MPPSSAQDPTLLTEIFKFETQTYSRNSYTLHWTCLGPDHCPPLIFVHGTPWSSRVWAPYARALANRFKVYLFDNPGFGRSPPAVALVEKPSFDDDVGAGAGAGAGNGNGNGAGAGAGDGEGVDQLSASLTTQAEALAILYYHCWGFGERRVLEQQPHVVAHDVGGLIALRAQLFSHCKFASLCLVDVVAMRPFGSPFFHTVAENSRVFRELPSEVFEAMLRAYIDGAAFRELPAAVKEVLVEPWIRGDQGQEGFIRQVAQADAKDVEEVEGRYRKVGKSLPVKVIWGIEDRWIPVERGVEIGKLLCAKEVVLVEEAGHLIMYDQREKLAIEIALWLAEVSASTKQTHTVVI